MEAPVSAHGISAHAPVEAKPAAAHSIAFVSERQAAVSLRRLFELLHHHETLEPVRPPTKPCQPRARHRRHAARELPDVGRPPALHGGVEHVANGSPTSGALSM